MAIEKGDSMEFHILALYFTAHAMGAVMRGDYDSAQVLARIAADDWSHFDVANIRAAVEYNTDKR